MQNHSDSTKIIESNNINIFVRLPEIISIEQFSQVYKVGCVSRWSSFLIS